MSSGSERHPFFNAMVLMGGSIALGCGGTVTDRRGALDRSDAGDPQGAPSGGASATGGTAPGTGPIIVQSKGGSSNAAGGSPTFGATGGSPGTGGYLAYPFPGTAGAGAGTGDPSQCPATQWDCSSPGVYCMGSADGWFVPPDCVCDTRRPRTRADCTATQSFVCRKGALLGDAGTPVGQLAFECYCVENATACSACDAVYTRNYDSECNLTRSSDGRMDLLCGCAVVYLR